MSQQPITMEQLKQILQLRNDGVAIREIARRTGISRNSIKKYLLRLEQFLSEVSIDLSNQQLAEAAYDNDTSLLAIKRRQVLTQHLTYAENELTKTGVTRHLLLKQYRVVPKQKLINDLQTSAECPAMLLQMYLLAAAVLIFCFLFTVVLFFNFPRWIMTNFPKVSVYVL